jgi:hypothetical protein
MNAIILTTVTAITLTMGVKGQSYSQYGAIEDFFMANPDVPNVSEYAGRVVNPHYILVDHERWQEMDARMIANGLVRLGVSSWQETNGPWSTSAGIPKRDLAVAYGIAIGADIVMYTSWTSESYPDPTTPISHEVAYYARKGMVDIARPAPSSIGEELLEAEHQLQAAWDGLPGWRRDQLRPGEREWIRMKDAAPLQTRLRMVQNRTAWLLQRR